MPNLPDMFEVLGFPVTLAFSKNGRVFFSERITGNLWEYLPSRQTGKHGETKLIKSFPIVPATGHHETGLLGIALDPDFEENDYIYCFYTYGNSPEDCRNIVIRIKTDELNEKTILDNVPGERIHNGGIMAFGPDGKLYIGIGVQNEIKEKSQEIGWLGGKILRINSDGSIPQDNPFPDSPVYSLGHRNIFGLAFHPKTGKLFISEPGQEENDEINIIEKGGNYGWPIVTGIAKNADYIDPIMTYTPTITPTQCCFVDNDFYFGSYNEGTVHKLTFDEKNHSKVVKDEVVYKSRPFGIIGVFCSPEKEFFVTTPNKIIKFEPTSS